MKVKTNTSIFQHNYWYSQDIHELFRREIRDRHFNENEDTSLTNPPKGSRRSVCTYYYAHITYINPLVPKAFLRMNILMSVPFPYRSPCAPVYGYHNALSLERINLKGLDVLMKIELGLFILLYSKSTRNVPLHTLLFFFVFAFFTPLNLKSKSWFLCLGGVNS